MPPGLKRGLEAVLARGGPAMVARAVRRDGILVLAYHNVVPHGATAVGLRSLHLSADQFRRQLDLMQRWLSVVPIAELAGHAQDRRPRAAITFDDAYRGAVTIALAELRERGLPATMFVAPGRLGGDQFWWDTLAAGERVEAGVERHALEDLRGEETVVRSWAKRTGVHSQDMPDLWRSASIEELDAAVYPGLTFGSHSWSHPNLSRLHGSEIDHELAASHDWLAARFPRSYVPWLAFPYGLLSKSARDAAANRGFVGALRIEGGWAHLPLAEPLATPRFNVPSHLSIDGFALRLSGLLRS